MDIAVTIKEHAFHIQNGLRMIEFSFRGISTAEMFDKVAAIMETLGYGIDDWDIE